MPQRHTQLLALAVAFGIMLSQSLFTLVKDISVCVARRFEHDSCSRQGAAHGDERLGLRRRQIAASPQSSTPKELALDLFSRQVLLKTLRGRSVCEKSSSSAREKFLVCAFCFSFRNATFE